MAKLMKFDEIVGNESYGGLNMYRPFLDKDVNGHVMMRVVRGTRSPKDKGKYTQPDHNHPKRDLFMVGIEGTRIMNVKGKNVLLKPGHILYIEPGDNHYSPELGSEDFVALELWYSAPGDESEEEQMNRLKLQAEREAKPKVRKR
ncbi:MAG: cupin domain-containing protein [Thaumarchaeota archaeon]|nr:cupin domain-containing protein [Nitrososphaerota archaeon]